jgi:hypothetical protein
LEHLFGDQTISAQSTETDATGSFAIEDIAAALIAYDGGTWMLCQQLEPAMTTAQNSRE